MDPQVDSSHFDVIIVGGGPAGCALALSLSQCAPELSFILVSDAIPSNFKIGESLPPEAKRLLHHLHPSLLKRFLEDEKKQLHLPSDGTASAWGSQEVEERHSILNPFGHGWHLDRAAFDETMRSVLQELRGGNCLKLGRFSGVRKEDGHWKVDISQSDSCNSYSANWIVDATGRKASVAAKLGAKTVKYDHLLAFYAVFSSDTAEDDGNDGSDSDRRTLIESTPTGWWYTSMLSNRRRVMVYHTDSTFETAKVARRLSGFLDLLHEETSHVSSIVQQYGYEIDSTCGNNFPQCTAAGSSSLEPLGDEDACWYAVGDAAMAFDPLSAQGMMTAMEMGFFVGKVLGARLTRRSIAGIANVESMGGVASTMESLRLEYEKKKEYYYKTETRFNTAFWSERRSDT